MNEGQEHQWHIELDYMRAQLRFVLDNLNDISKRDNVKGKIENVYKDSLKSLNLSLVYTYSQ